jgi:Protein of unknown function (DUF3405)
MDEKKTGQAFLILTKHISKRNIRFYKEIKKAASGLGDVFLLYHNNGDMIPQGVQEIKIETFTNDVLTDLQYQPITNTLIPGSNHFPVLNFFLNNPQYKYYWCIEDDVRFRGNWEKLFKNISSGINYDFISSHIRRYADIPEWVWWDSFNSPEEIIDKKDMFSSFNPIYRISNKALRCIDSYLKRGFAGHHEMIFPTILKREDFTLADFSTKQNYITPSLGYCTLSTMRWKPIFFIKGFKKNKLYHPVKEKITLEQTSTYFKRTFRNKMEYFT